jgi:NAD(P)-dependent dehydrogenase (short-subunit alcohol dehydrogenase family)
MKNPLIPDYLFDGKVVLITGAGQGIAAAAAKALAERGAKVGVCDRQSDRASAIADEIRKEGGDAVALVADVSIETDVMRVAGVLVETFGPIDILINGAGSYGKSFRETHDTPVEEWDDVFASNVRGTFLCAKAVLPNMVERKTGRIVNISSNAGRSVSPLLGCSYTAAKAAVIGISRHLSREYAAKGILVNTICPGPVDGQRVSHLLETGSVSDDLAASIPVGRLGTNEDIAAAILFLASDSCSFMTGAVLDVSGGLILA